MGFKSGWSDVADGESRFNPMMKTMFNDLLTDIELVDVYGLEHWLVPVSALVLCHRNLYVNLILISLQC
jgi:hypothetical protein